MSPYADVTIRVIYEWQLAHAMRYADAALLGSPKTATAVVLDEGGRVLARFERGKWKRATAREVRS